MQKDSILNNCFVVALSLAIAAGPFGGLGLISSGSSASAAGTTVSFKEDVLPIFQVHCVSCHTPGREGTTTSGLDLTSWQGVMTGTKYGAMVIPGNVEYSNLMWLLDWRASPQLRMPHGKQQLPAGERDSIRSWIRQGAKDN
jgi:mono/diheme cytochrome c family protein